MKKKLFALMMMLCPLLFMSNATAAGITVYVKATTAPYLYYWGGASTSWPGEKLTQTTTVNGTSFWYKEFSSANSLNIIFNNGSGSQTSDITGLSSATGKYYYTYNGSTNYTDVTAQYGTVQDATISSMGISGNLSPLSWSSVTAFTEVTANKVYTYTLDLTDTESDLDFKLRPNDAWVGYSAITFDAPSGWITGSDNVTLKNSTTGYATYTLTATWAGGTDASVGWTLKIEGKDERTGTITPVEHTYTIVGEPAAVFGTEWAPTAEDNLMVLGDDGKYTKTFENVTLTNGTTIKYKVAEDKAWTVSYGWNGNNCDYAITEDGIYDLTFTFNPNGSTDYEKVNVNVTKKQSAEVEHTYTVVGDNTDIFGTAWDPTLTDNDMTKNETTGIYTWTKENVTIQAGTTVYYKVAQDHAWDVSYGYDAGSDGNADYVVSEGGIYTVAFTFDPSKTIDTERLYAVFTKTADLPVETQDFTVSFTDPGWDAVYAYAWTGDTPVAAWPGTQLTKTGDVYTYTVTAVTAPENIIFNNGDGNGKQTPDLAFVADKTYTHIYTVVGNTNGNEAGADDLVFGKAWEVTLNPMTEQADGTWTLTKEVELTETTSIQFKAAYGNDWEITYGKSDGGNQDYNDVAPGKYTVTFTLNLAAEGDKMTATFEPVKQDYTVTFVNTGNWAEVAAYAWSGEGESATPVAAWPGTKLEKTDTKEIDGVTYDVYTYTVNAVAAPEKILFNDNKAEGATQTDDLAFVAGQEYSYEVPPTYTVTFVNTGKWDEVAAYAWTTEGETTTNFSAAWPGDKLMKTTTKTIDGITYDVYSWSYTGKVAPARIIFNDNKAEEAQQTEDYEFVDGKEYSTALPTFTVTFVNTGDWAEVAAYAWTDGNPTTEFAGAWPGKALETTGEKVDGHDVYTYTVQAAVAPEKIIFNDNKAEGATQTDDEAFVDGKQYSYIVPQTITATFVNTGDWTKVYAWAWTTEGEGEAAVTTNYSGEWPGVELTEKAAEQIDGHDVYVFTYTGKTLPASILFNNGEGTQTKDFTLVNGQQYEYSIEVGVTFVNTGKWAEVYAYTWTGENQQAGAWPGTKLAKSGTENIDGTDYDVYSWSYTGIAAPANIIFNDGNGTQTEDLEFVDGKTYSYEAKQTLTIYFINERVASEQALIEWNDGVYMYVWDDADQKLNGDFPGEQMTKEDRQISINGKNYDLYKWTKTIALDANHPKGIIFSNGTGGMDNQTGNMEFVNNMYYTFTGNPYEDVEWNGRTCYVFDDNITEFTAHNATEARPVIYNREFTVDMPSTFCLPFALDEDNIAAIAEGGTVFELKSFDGKKLIYNSVKQTEANKPYYFLPKKQYAFTQVQVTSTTVTPYFDVKVVEKTPETMPVTAQTGNDITAEMVGSYSTFDLTSDDEWTYFAYSQSDVTDDAGGVQAGEFAKASVLHVKPFRAYIRIKTAEMLAKGITDAKFDVQFGDDATAIRTINAADGIDSGKVYTIDGRVVNTDGSVNGLARGLYIINGKKYVVK